jgi:dihydrofolate synthase/folylpolyglutamate synthase
MNVPADPALATRVAEIEREILSRAPEHDIVPTLDRVAAVLDMLGTRSASFRVIHVTGTNGKTSTTRLIEALLP